MGLLYQQTKRVFEKCSEGPFCGVCYAGMGEYVFQLVKRSTGIYQSQWLPGR